MEKICHKILQFSLKNDLFKALKSNNSKAITFGPLASLVASNIKNEWIKSNCKKTDMNVFLFESDEDKCLVEICDSIPVKSEELPFAISYLCANPTGIDKSSNLFKDFSPPQNNEYRCFNFVDKEYGEQYFHRKQQEHKSWWRKFSTDPERFKTTVENVGEKNGRATINISAEFPWGTELVEQIHYYGCCTSTKFGPLFANKKIKKKLLPHVIESVCLENPAVLTYICDAFDELPTRSFFRFHSSLAPYKIALVVDPSDDQIEDLKQLATLVCWQMSQAGIHPFDLDRENPLEHQFDECDSIGIPYTVVLKASTLVHGIVFLRSRDTTLEEEVHISKVISYLQLIFQN